MPSVQSMYRRLYAKSEEATDLPWHNETIPKLLETTVKKRGSGTALDLGCGTGVHASYLARQGFKVTAIDFIADALAMAKKRADHDGAGDIEFVHADVLQWETGEQYDIVFDSGCLHSWGDRQQRLAYKRRILSWLSAEGDYVLLHFLKRHPLDWRPVGPRRRYAEEVRSFFKPELTADTLRRDYVPGVPLPVGPTALMGQFRFRWAENSD